MNKICSKCMSTTGCQCLPTKDSKGHNKRQEVQYWTIHKSPAGASLIKFIKNTLNNGFEIPSGYTMWFKPNECMNRDGAETTASRSKLVFITNEGLNRLIKDINTKKLKGVL